VVAILEGSPGGFSEPPAEPTPQQNELFHLTVRNFVNTASSHRQVLVDCRLSLAGEDIDKWTEGQNLPASLARRGCIMDFIWNHYCNCRCS
jgi:hypothetical protein